MSEKDKRINAKQKGFDAYFQGIPREQNPMRAEYSRIVWFKAWDKAKKDSEASRKYAHHDGKPNVCGFCGAPAIGGKICVDCLNGYTEAEIN